MTDRPVPTLLIHPLAKPRFAWLLWLALLLPIAQTAATWHAYSHANPAGVEEKAGKDILHASHCDLCLTAAALIGGGAPAAPMAALQALAGHEVRVAKSVDAWIAPAEPVYQSRAPPSP